MYLPSKALTSTTFNLVAAAVLYSSEPIGSAYRFGSTQLWVDGLGTVSGPTHHLMAQRSLGAELQLLHRHGAVMVVCVPGMNTHTQSIPSILAQLNSCNKKCNRKKKKKSAHVFF